MLWAKVKLKIKIKATKGQQTLKAPVSGDIQHLMIIPGNKETEWNLIIKDKDADVIFDETGIGRMDYKGGIPVGQDVTEKLTFKFTEVTKDDVITVILKVREK